MGYLRSAVLNGQGTALIYLDYRKFLYVPLPQYISVQIQSHIHIREIHLVKLPLTTNEQCIIKGDVLHQDITAGWKVGFVISTQPQIGFIIILRQFYGVLPLGICLNRHKAKHHP